MLNETLIFIGSLAQTLLLASLIGAALLILGVHIKQKRGL